MKIFAWRACINGLPILYNLRCRGLNSVGFCSLCDKCMETTTHALIHCAHAKDTWALLLDCPIDLVAAELDILDIASQIFEKGTSRNPCMCRCIADGNF